MGETLSDNPVCGHCGTMFFPRWERTAVFWHEGGEDRVCAAAAECPSCNKIVVRLEIGNWSENGHDFGRSEWNVDRAITIYPNGCQYPPAPKEVPSDIAEDYREAWEVLPISPRASAALSRRCLQAVLAAHGYDHNDLKKQIRAALSEADPQKALPALLHDTLDAIRGFGNFSAHPVNDKITLEVMKIDPHEAEFCLNILTELFDHYYVRPLRYQRIIEGLDVKLSASGRPTIKGARSPASGQNDA